MKVSDDTIRSLNQTITALDKDRKNWWGIWRELADYYLPRRYVALLTPQERNTQLLRNPYILDSTGTKAARTLASGMMNGITSPSRPWFKLTLAGRKEIPHDARIWLDEVTRRLLMIMAESNFYNGLAVMYLDLVIFGTAAMIIYEDDESVIRCYNPALGEFFVGQSHRLQVDRFAREFTLKTNQLRSLFGEKNLPASVRERLKSSPVTAAYEDHKVYHLIEPNEDNRYNVGKQFRYREIYWLKSNSENTILRAKGFRELPVICPRWELAANDAYGSCPAMDAFGDVIQLQHETKKKAQGLDRMNEPPMVLDATLKNQKVDLLPRGMTFVSGNSNVGVKPAMTVTPPIAEMTADLREVQLRIRETFHNDLFRMISQLDTVRSATEIDARREEKLVLLGPVLERFEAEGLDPGINRVFSIAERKGLIPEPPDSIADAPIEIQYVSILSVAQRAVATAPVERWLGMIGEIAGAKPEVLNIPNFDELIRGYGEDLGVPARYMNQLEEAQRLTEQQQQVLEAQEAANTGQTLAATAKTLSEAEVGGGANVLQELIGG